MNKKSGDLEFHLSEEEHPLDVFKITTDFDEAAGTAIARCCSNGATVFIDVIAWTRAAAHRFGGSDGAEEYDEDPEASVHKRIVVKAEDIGRIP